MTRTIVPAADARTPALPAGLWRRIAAYFDAHPRALDLTLIAIVTAAAAVLRLTLLGRIPYGVHSDEAQLGTDGYKILDGDLWTVYTHAVLGQPSGHTYLTLPSFELLGWTPLAMRLPLALVGLAAIPLLYVLVRISLGRVEAFFGSAMLAVSYWHLFYSRVAHWSISYGTVLLGAFVCLFMGMNTRQRRWFPASGIVLGIGFYTYNIYPIAVVAFTAFVAIMAFGRYRPEWRWWLRSVGITYLAAFVVALPMIVYVANPDSFYWYHINNYGDVRVTQEQAYKDANTWGKVEVIGDQVRDFVAAYAWDPPLDIVDGNGQRPMFDVTTVVLLLAGLVIAFFRRREPMIIAALCCFVIIPLPAVPQEGSIMRQPLAAAPYAMLLAALPLAALWRRATERNAVAQPDAGAAERRPAAPAPPSSARQTDAQPFARAVIAAVPLFVLAAITFTTVHDYFWTLRKDDWIRLIYFSQMTTASDYMRRLPPGTYVLFYSERASINLETRQFLAPDVQGEDRSAEFNAANTSTNIPDPARPTTFVLLDKYLSLLPDIERRYPGGTERKILRDGKIEFYAYEVPAQAP